MQNFENQIKEELIKNSYENLTKGNAWEFFKKSNYYKYLQNEPAKFRTENAIRYAQKFLSDMQDLNLNVLTNKNHHINNMIITGFIEDARNERCSDAEVVKLSQIFAELFPSFLADSKKSENNAKWYCEVIGGFSLTTTKTKSD